MNTTEYIAKRDPCVWIKTDQERKLLKSLRKRTKMHFNSIPCKEIPVLAKLIVYLKKNKEFPHTTYSTMCYMNHIGSVLSRYSDLVSKYSYNGKTYLPSERPFWK